MSGSPRGRSLKVRAPLDINLNHGSYGSPPIPVIDAMRTLSEQCEQNPDLFMRKTYIPLLDAVRKQLSEMVNADVDDCVLVSTARHSRRDGTKTAPAGRQCDDRGEHHCLEH